MQFGAGWRACHICSSSFLIQGITSQQLAYLQLPLNSIASSDCSTLLLSRIESWHPPSTGRVVLVPGSTHLRLLKTKLGSFQLGYQGSMNAVYLPLDQVEKTTSNCFPRFRWELGNLDRSSEFFCCIHTAF